MTKPLALASLALGGTLVTAGAILRWKILHDYERYWRARGLWRD